MEKPNLRIGKFIYKRHMTINKAHSKLAVKDEHVAFAKKSWQERHNTLKQMYHDKYKRRFDTKKKVKESMPTEFKNPEAFIKYR